MQTNLDPDTYNFLIDFIEIELNTARDNVRNTIGRVRYERTQDKFEANTYWRDIRLKNEWLRYKAFLHLYLLIKKD